MADNKDQKQGAAPAKKEAGKNNDKKGEKVEELSEEDARLKEELDMLVETLKGADASLYSLALNTMRTLIRTATSSMTSVPKPLKFLRLRYQELVDAYERWEDAPYKSELADILSVLAMTAAPTTRDTLKYRKLGTKDALGSWGHEYVRFLTADVIKEFSDRFQNGITTPEENADLHALAAEIVPFCIAHNAEADAADLLMELETIDRIVEHVDEKNYERVCLYLISCVSYVPEPEDQQVLRAVLAIYRKLGKWPEAVLISLRLFDIEGVQETIAKCTDPVERQQLAFIIGQHRLPVPLPDDMMELASNSHMSEHFLYLARELDVLEAKTPEDIYKTHLEPTRPGLGGVVPESSRHNLASSFVNAFVNAGFKSDKLMTTDAHAWLMKNKDNGQLAATASLGMLYLWDIDGGLGAIDAHLYSKHDHAKAGALLGIGIVNCGVINDNDPALALLTEYVDSQVPILRTCAILGLGLAYSGTRNQRVADLLVPILVDTSISMEIAAMAGLALGLVFVSSCDVEIAERFLQTMLERQPGHLAESSSRFLALGLAFLYLGRQDAADATAEAIKAVASPLDRQATVLLEICAYAGTGNVLMIQRMLQYCTDHLDGSKENDVFQGFATIGIALIAMGEEIGNEMSRRTFNHLMQYGELVIRRAVPLAAALLCTSNPQDVGLLDTLSKYTHDNDPETAQSAIFALGIIGAGTNNARVAQLLRHLASYYQKDASTLLIVRLSQGLLHMGKGTMTLNPYHMNRQLLCPPSIAALMAVTIAMTDVKSTLLGMHPYLLYLLVPAMRPRCLITLDEKLGALSVAARVGKAVDTVGQAGRPKTITGFQTHTTPVLLAAGERAELATEEYIPVSRILEGFVILKKNPDAATN